MPTKNFNITCSAFNVHKSLRVGYLAAFSIKMLEFPENFLSLSARFT